MLKVWKMTNEQLENIANDDEHEHQLEAERELSMRETIDEDPRVAQAMGEI